MGVLTSTLCGCFSGGTAGGRVRASVTGPVPGPSATTAIRGIPGDTRVHKRGRGHPGQARAVALGSTWHDVQDTQPATTAAPS